MRWYQKLYLGEGLEEDRENLIRRIECNAGNPGIYMITLASNGRDLFDIFSADMLLQPVLHGLCPMIVGLAQSWDEAVEIASSIALEAYKYSGDFNVYEYLKSRTDKNKEVAYDYPMDKLKPRRKRIFRKQ